MARFSLVAAAAVLAVTALAGSASAADDKGTLAFVNGRPGTKVDVCLGGKELRSGLPYGGVYRKDVVGTGNKVLRFYAQDPRKCRGALLASKALNIVAGYDQTIVLTKKAPKIVMFDNTTPIYMGEIPPRGAPFAGAYFSWSSAADFDVNFIYTLYAVTEGPSPIGPSANPIWTKGSRYTQAIPAIYIMKLMATMPENPAGFVERMRLLSSGRRYEWILVGTNKGNAKMVLFDRTVSAAS